MAMHYAINLQSRVLCGQHGDIDRTANPANVTCKRCKRALDDQHKACTEYVEGVDMATGPDKTVVTTVRREPNGTNTVVDAREVGSLGLRMMAKERRVRVLRTQEYEGEGDEDRTGVRRPIAVRRITVLFKGSERAYRIWRSTHKLDEGDVVEDCTVRPVMAYNRRGDNVVRNAGFTDFAKPLVEHVSPLDVSTATLSLWHGAATLNHAASH
jgi:hypothetical protein